MKRTYWILAFTVFVASACQPSRGIWIHAQLPALLAKDSRRYRTFLLRASHLRVHLETKAGHTWDGTFPPSAWERIAAPALSFPEGKGDKLDVAVELWDLTSDGHLRGFAALSGNKNLTADDLPPDGLHDLPLRLVLQVPPKEYD